MGFAQNWGTMGNLKVPIFEKINDNYVEIKFANLGCIPLLDSLCLIALVCWDDQS